MAIRDYWVYQKRDVAYPWALYIVKEYDKRHPEVTTLDWTLYHEDIPNQMHCKSVVNVHCSTVSGYVDELVTFMFEYVPVTFDDKEQLRRSVENILLH